MLELLGLIFGGVTFLGCVDRLRCINWKTSRPLVVLFYLVGALWSLGIVYDSVAAGVQWYQLLGIGSILIGLVGTRHRWRYGPPADVSKPAPLGEPELRKDSRWQ